MHESNELTIGDVARQSGIPATALRFYESAGLLAPARRVSGRRRYDSTVFATLELVRLAQDAGFTISEIRHLLRGFARGTPMSARWEALARRKRAEVLERMARARDMVRILDGLLACECTRIEQCVAYCRPSQIRRKASRSRPAIGS